MLRVACSILVLVVAATGYGQAQMSPEAMLEGGIRAEVVDGNLAEAIAIYESVASRPDVDRAVAAKALLHLAGCYEKLGDDRSLLAYRRIVDEYADVATHAASARERLAMLEAPAPPAASQDGIVLPSIPPDVDTGGAYDYTVSPDGRYGVFTSYSRDAQNIGLLDYETGGVTWVTDFPSFPEAQADAPAFSPDSSRVAYSVARRRAGAVEVHVATLGEPAEVVYRADFDDFGGAVPIWLTGWTPDGGGLVGTMNVGGGWKMIFKLDLASGELTQIATLDWSGIGDPWLSPDGSTFAMVRMVDGNRDIYTLSADGSNMSRLTDHPAQDRSPLWSRDGRHLLFTSDRLGEQSLWAVPVERGERAGPPILLRSPFIGRYPGWAGDRFTFVEYRSSSDLFTLAFSGEAAGSPRRVPHAPAGEKYMVAWGSRGDLSFVEWRGEQRMAVILHPDGTTTERRLPADLGRGASNMGFNAAGTVAAFAGNGRIAFYELAADAFSVFEIPPEPLAWRPAMRHATFRGSVGEFVVYYPVVSPDRASFEVRRFDTRTADATTVYTSAEPRGGQPMWLSPDGQSLRFVEGSSYRELDLAGGSVEDLLPDTPLMTFYGPVSSFDGSTIVARLAPQRNNRFRLFDMDREGLTREIPIATGNLFGEMPGEAFEVEVNSFAVSPSGKELAFVAVAESLRRYLTEDPLAGVLSDDGSR
jgi:hypothetical protein